MIFVTAFLGSLQQIANTAAPTLDAITNKTVSYASNEMPGNTFLSSSPDQRGVAQYKPQPIDSVDDANTALKQEIEPPQTAQSQSPTDLESDFDNNNVNVGDADLSADDNTVVSSRTYNVGEYELDETEKDKAADYITRKIIDKIEQDLEDNSDKKVKSIKISKKIFDAISHQDNKNSNIANDGSDLGKGRLDTEREINSKSDAELKPFLKQLKSQGITVEITDTDEIETHDSVSSQKIQAAQDGLTTQSSGTTVDVDIEYGEKGKEASTILQYIAVYYDPNNGTTPISAPDGDKKQGTEDNKPETSQDTPPPVPTDSEIERDVKAIANLNRQSQIAFLLAKTSPGENQEKPGLNLFKALGLNTSTNITAGELNSIADQGVYKGKEVSINAKNLARAIRRLVKSKPTIINAYARLTGVKTKEKAARGSITQKGVTGKSANAPIREEFSNLTQLLSEADDVNINNLLKSVGSLSTQQAAYLAKLVNVMYVGEEGGDVLDSESSEDKNFKAEYDKIKSPLASREKGEKYVFLDKKQGTTKIQPDITRIDRAIEADKPLMTVLSRINTQDELASLLTALFIHKDKKGQSMFPDDKTFTSDPGRVRSALFGLNYRLKEAEEELPFDVKDFYSRIDKSPNLKNALAKINSLEEFYQFLLYNILPRISPTLLKDKNKLKAAIAKAANASKQFAEKGKYNVDENLI